MKYIIMECHASYAVLLDEKGRFLKAANRQYQIGQTVEDPVLMKESGLGKRVKLRAVMGIAAAAACFLLAFTGYYRDYMVRDASICLTINPSVRLELNRKGQVMRVSGVNEDGRKLLEGYRQSSRDRLTVTKELIGRAMEMGYLSAGSRIVLDIDAPEEAVFQKYGVELRTGLSEYLEDTLEVEIEIIRHENGAEETSEPLQKPEEGQTPSPVEIEIERKELQELPPEEPDPAETAPETAESKQEETAPETKSRCEQPRQDTTQGETSGHKDIPAEENASAPESGSDHDGDSGYEAGPDYENGSNDGEGPDYDSGSNYGEGSDYDSGSNYGEGPDYENGSNYGEGSDYDSGSNYREGSDYDSGSHYGEGSNHDGDSGYDSLSDYE